MTRRHAGCDKSKPQTSAVPPARIRWSKRVTATLHVSSSTVDTGAIAASVMGMVSE
jgi:hypothetical protein